MPDSERPATSEDGPAAGGDLAAESPVADETMTPVTVRSRRPKLVLLGGIAVVVVALDLLTKLLVVSSMQEGESRRILGGLIYLSLYRNSGAAFSMATGMTWVLSLIVIVVIIAILRLSRRLKSTAWAICFGLILGGAIGNLIDRIFRAPGFPARPRS